jgi:hypothetical protein
MARWLAPRLPGPQHWVLHDRDAELLALAAEQPPGPAAGGTSVVVEPRPGDVIRLDADELHGASLVVASALLDMLTADEVGRLVASCVGAGCPVLVTLSVVGRVELTPADPVDAEVAAAFDEHQRRVTAAGRLLGPDAFRAAVDGFRRAGHDVHVRPSPWRLGPDRAALAEAWFRGWVGAAVEQRPELREATTAYTNRRLAQAAGGRLSVEVHHEDLLALPAVACEP